MCGTDVECFQVPTVGLALGCWSPTPAPDKTPLAPTVIDLRGALLHFDKQHLPSAHHARSRASMP
jgi:hypothetical protein